MASYELVGVIKVACVSGCLCQETLIETHIAIRYTGEESKDIALTQVSGQCHLRVTNMPRDSTGLADGSGSRGRPGPKVKITSVSLHL